MLVKVNWVIQFPINQISETYWVIHYFVKTEWLFQIWKQITGGEK